LEETVGKRKKRELLTQRLKQPTIDRRLSPGLAVAEK
jgi:hypothetical protein